MEIAKELIYGEGSQSFPQAHASTLIQLDDGSYWVAWFGGTKEKSPDVSIWGAQKNENGWSEPVKLAKIKEEAHWNPVLHYEDGTIYLFFKVGESVLVWHTWLITSDDNGKTWSSPVELVPGDLGERGPAKNKLIVLSDGSWLAPNSVETETDWRACTDKSSDKGKTWLQSDLIPIREDLINSKSDNRIYSGVIQPTLWESQPGSVHMLLRSTYGKICRSDSSNYGESWSEIYPTDLPNNNSGIDLAKFADGTLAMLYNPVPGGARTPLTLALSKDNGQTWPVNIDLETEKGCEFSYPAIIATSDGLAFSYTWKRKSVVFGEMPNQQVKELWNDNISNA